MTTTQANKILIDWGTTNVRCFLVDAYGHILDQRTSDKGIKFVDKGDYPEVYHELTSGWSKVNFTLMAGMVGSANGWEEAPYTALPTSIDEIGNSIHKLSSMDNIYIVGGLSYQGPNLTYDVIRGEEVQILGLLEQLDASNTSGSGKKLICLPGTHSKWLEIEDKVISSFTTIMSGDFFSAICSSTIMSMMLEEKQIFSSEVFSEGVELSRKPGGIMSHMFKVRGASLFNQIKPHQIESMISGIVIGSEIDEMQKIYDTTSTIHIIGSANLTDKYTIALKQLGLNYQLHTGEKLSLTGMNMLSEKLISSFQ